MSYAEAPERKRLYTRAIWSTYHKQDFQCCSDSGLPVPIHTTAICGSHLSASVHAICFLWRSQMTDNAGLRAVISKAQVIDELENTLPGWVKRQPTMFPAYIHVLKVPLTSGRLLITPYRHLAARF